MPLTKYLQLLEEHMAKYGLIPENKELVVLYSGGKDSSALVALMEEYRKKDPDLKITYINIAFPQDVFGLDLNRKLAEIKGVLKDFHSAIPTISYEALEQEDDPCQMCKEVRRRYIKDLLRGKKYMTIATGHNTNDLIAYFAELFKLDFKDLQAGVDFEALKKVKIKNKYLEHFSRFFPKLTLDSGVTLVKPFLPFNRLQVLEIMRLKNIKPYLEPCKYGHYRPKRELFKEIYDLPVEEAIKIYKDNGFEKLKKELNIHSKNFDKALEEVRKQEYSSLLL